MYALPFDGIGESGTIGIQELFKDPLTTFKGGSNAANADQIMFWYNGTYKSLYLFSTTATAPAAFARHGKWINPGTVPDSSLGTPNQPSALAIPGGTSFWIKRYIAAANKDGGELQNAALPALDVTVSGQVVTKAAGTASYAITAATADAPSYTLVAAGFSAPFIPNPDKVDSSKATIDWLAMGCKGGSNAASADQLMVGKEPSLTLRLGLRGIQPLFRWLLAGLTTGGAAPRPRCERWQVGVWGGTPDIKTRRFKPCWLRSAEHEAKW